MHSTSIGAAWKRRDRSDVITFRDNACPPATHFLQTVALDNTELAKDKLVMSG
jgi:hypothetical protein